jgi:hypothetical protein
MAWGEAHIHTRALSNAFQVRPCHNTNYKIVLFLHAATLSYDNDQLQRVRASSGLNGFKPAPKILHPQLAHPVQRSDGIVYGFEFKNIH